MELALPSTNTFRAGALFRRSCAVFVWLFPSSLLMALLCYGPFLAFEGENYPSPWDIFVPRNAGPWLGARVAMSALLAGVLIQRALGHLRAEPVHLVRSIGWALKRGFLLTSVLVIMSAFRIGCFYLLIFPMFMYLAASSVALPVAITEGGRPFAVLQRSYDLTRGFRGEIFFAYVCAFLLMISLGILSWFLMPLVAPFHPLAAPFVAVLFDSFCAIFDAILTAVIYLECRAQKEGFALDDIGAGDRIHSAPI
jgi:hypothetical protein